MTNVTSVIYIKNKIKIFFFEKNPAKNKFQQDISLSIDFSGQMFVQNA